MGRQDSSFLGQKLGDSQDGSQKSQDIDLPISTPVQDIGLLLLLMSSLESIEDVWISLDSLGYAGWVGGPEYLEKVAWNLGDS